MFWIARATFFCGQSKILGLLTADLAACVPMSMATNNKRYSQSDSICSGGKNTSCVGNPSVSLDRVSEDAFRGTIFDTHS